MILSQFLWYFSPFRNATHFLTWEGSLDLKKRPFELVGTLFWLTTSSLWPLVSGFPFVCTLWWITSMKNLIWILFLQLFQGFVLVPVIFLFYLSLFIDSFLPWIRWLVAGLLQRRPKFHLRPVHVEYVVDKVSLGQVLSPSTSGFPLHYYSTNVSSSYGITYDECNIVLTRDKLAK